MQVGVPGKAEFRLKTPGSYTIFLEEQSVVNGGIYSTTPSVNGLKCRVTSQPGKKEIALRNPGMPASYTVNGRAARSALEFSVEQGGQRELSCRYPEHTKGPEAVFAVRTGWSEKILGTVGRSFAAIFGGGGSGLAIILLV